MRALEDDPVGYPAELWKQMAALDLIGLMVPAAYGGSEMSALEGAVVYTELGRALAPSPHFVSAVMGAGVLLRAGTDEQKQSWLPRIVSGDAIVTTAWLEPGNGFGPRGVQTRAVADGDGFVLDGVKWHVPFAKAATAMIVLARTGDADSDVDLFLVDPDAAGVTLEQQLTIASDTQYEVTLAGVRVPAAARIGAAGTGWATWNETMLDGVDHARGPGRRRRTLRARHHRAVRQGPRAVRQAARRVPGDLALPRRRGDRGRRRRDARVRGRVGARRTASPIDRLAPMAKLFACKTFRDVTAMAQQVFGGVGFTVEYDIQLYFRRAKQLQISWWDDRALEELVAGSVFGS